MMMRPVLAVVGLLLLLAQHQQHAAVHAQTLSFAAGSPALTNTYDWRLQKRVGNNPASAVFTAPRGSSIELPYSIIIERVLVSSTATLSVIVSCPSGSTSATVSLQGGAAVLATGAITPPAPASFNNIPIAVPAGGGSPGALVAACASPVGSSSSPAVPIVFTPANTAEVRGTGTLSDVITFPTWAQFFPTGNWLTTAPATAVTSGMYPGSGTTVRSSQTISYVYTISNTVLCFTGATVSNTATLVAGTGADTRTYSDTASASISITNCDVQPSITVTTPNTQTALTYAWTQSITPVTSTALQVPWGGGGNVAAQATFTRTVTSSVLTVTMNLQVSNPSAAPIAINNLQLSCPWGGNTLLPCGAVATGATGAGIASATLLVIPASGTINCMINNLQIQGTWGVDFTQPCTIMTSNWLGTQATLPGLVLNFNAPTRLFAINNCALWSISCTSPVGSAFWVPQVGGLPVSQQVCGSDVSNAPLPPRPFTVTLGGGWIGDGTQPAACASSVSVACQSSLQLQSTAGTSQAFGGTQTAGLTITATPVQCPLPRSPTPAPAPPLPGQALLTSEPTVTPVVTRTVIRGSFKWAVASSASPVRQRISQGGPPVLARYTVTATPQAAGATDAPQYLLEGVVRVVNPDALATVRVEEVQAVVDGAAVPLACNPGLPYVLGPSAGLSCAVLVNYNRGAVPDVLFGRAVFSTEVGTRRTVDGTGARFGWESADVSQARGACVRVSQGFATNWFELVQASGVAPSFDAQDPTTVCAPATWTFNVKFTPKDGAPCGPQQAIQTVTASWGSGNATQSQSSSNTATLQVTGPECPAPPAGSGSSDGPGVRGGGGSIIEERGPNSAPPPAPAPAQEPAAASAATGLVALPQGGRPARPSRMVDALNGAAAAAGSMKEFAAAASSLAVVLSPVQSQRAPDGGWQLAVTPEAANVTLRAPVTPITFKLSWMRGTPASVYSGSVTVANTGAGPLELDSLVVDLMDAPAGSGQVVASTHADCPASSSGSSSSAVQGATQVLSSSNTLTLPSGARLTCNYTLRSGSSGAIVASATSAGGDAAGVSAPAAATPAAAAAASSCAQLVAGAAASELGPRGVLSADNVTQEVCGAGARLLVVNAPRDAVQPGKCVYPVAVIAWLRPNDPHAQAGAVAVGRADALVESCAVPVPVAAAAAAAPRAAVSTVALSKGRSYQWAVDMRTDPDMANDTFEVGDTLEVTTTWQQELAPGARMNASGVVVVRSGPGISKAKVTAIPLCAPGDANSMCAPVSSEAVCRAAADNPTTARCRFEFTGLPLAPGLLLPAVDGARPAAATAYDPARARWGLKPPAPLCARLSEEHTIKALDGGTQARVATQGAAAPLAGGEPFCGMQRQSNLTLSFAQVECGKSYVFNSRAVAAPTTAGAPPVAAELAFNVTC